MWTNVLIRHWTTVTLLRKENVTTYTGRMFADVWTDIACVKKRTDVKVCVEEVPVAKKKKISLTGFKHPAIDFRSIFVILLYTCYLYAFKMLRPWPYAINGRLALCNHVNVFFQSDVLSTISFWDTSRSLSTNVSKTVAIVIAPHSRVCQGLPTGVWLFFVTPFIWIGLFWLFLHHSIGETGGGGASCVKTA